MRKSSITLRLSTIQYHADAEEDDAENENEDETVLAVTTEHKKKRMSASCWLGQRRLLCMRNHISCGGGVVSKILERREYLHEYIQELVKVLEEVFVLGILKGSANTKVLHRSLNHCLPKAGLMHNAILHRVVRAIRKDVFVEQSISPDALKPDIVVRDQATKATTVVDITVPYEGSATTFLQARTLKEQKYAGFKSWMEGQEEYGAVTVHAFIVGALGAWDTANKECLRALMIGCFKFQFIV